MSVDSNHRIGQIVNLILALLLLLGLALTIYAINQVRTLKSEAASPKTTAATTTASIKLNESNPHLGSTVTFTTTYPKSVKYPRVAVRCFQNETMVYAEAGTYDHAFVLGGASSDWLRAGGAASCTAELFYFIWHGNNPQEYYNLAWTSFNAAGQ